MLDYIRTIPSPDSAFDGDDERVRQSAQRLFERLNPIVRDRGIAADAEPLAVYDWEIAGDTGLQLQTVRSALRFLNGRVIVVGTVNDEHRVTALTER